MLDKINETLLAQKGQLLKFLNDKENLQTQLKTTTDAIAQLRGSIAALEYVKGLDPKV
jgi:hypothetical protein